MPAALQPRPDPIHITFAKLKALLRSADERSTTNVWHRISDLLNEFSPDECANYLHHAGGFLNVKQAQSIGVIAAR